MQLIDTLKTMLEPMKFLIDRNSKRIAKIESTPSSVQSDMAQSDPKAPDYIKNRIVYDDRERELIFEGDVATNQYAGASYQSDYLDFVLEEGALYEIEFGDSLYIERCTPPDGNYVFVNVYGKPLRHLGHNVNRTDSYASGDYMSEPMHMKVSRIHEDGGYKTLPKHLVPEYRIADDTYAGVVKVSAVESGVNQSYVLPVIMNGANGMIYAENPLPANPQEDKLYVRWDFKNKRWVADAYPWVKSTNGNHYKLTFDKTTPVFKSENNSTIWRAGTFMPEATSSDSGKIPMVQEDGSWGLGETLVISSSTEGSTKKFRLTVDDDGLITAQEIT